MLQRVVSGGQTGVDRAALDFAIANNISHGGWCPKGRLAVDGVLPPIYLLRETESDGYRQRTKLNVQDSDATLIINMGELDGGSSQTRKFAESLRKPCLIVQLDGTSISDSTAILRAWLLKFQIATLNVAGPREQKRPGIYLGTMNFLNSWLVAQKIE